MSTQEAATNTSTEHSTQKERWSLVLNQPNEDAAEQRRRKFEMYEQMCALSRAQRDLLPHRLQVFFYEIRTTLGEAAIRTREAQHAVMLLDTRHGVDQVIHTTFGTPAFVTYTRRAFRKEGFAETARALDQSRQATYRHITTIEAKLEFLPEVYGKVDDGIIAQRLWKEAIVRLGIPIDKFWARAPEGTIAQARAELRAFEYGRLQRMSREALLKEEQRLVLAGMMIRERLEMVRQLAPTEA